MQRDNSKTENSHVFQTALRHNTFETNNDEEPDDIMKKAILSINEKVDRALHDVGKLTTEVF